MAKRVGIAALLLGASQLLSRLLGIVRETVLAAQVGAGAEVDAYRAAFQLPDLLNHFLAVGAIATAFIPLFHRVRQRDGDAAAERFFANVWGTLTLAVVVATGFLLFFADRFVALYFGDFSPEVQALTTRLTRIVLPAQIFFVTGGIVRGVLMAEGRFGAQALAPLVYNLGIIAGGLLGASRGVEGFAWGALVGAALGHFAIPLWDARGRIPLRMRVAVRDADFGQYLWTALPLLAGVTLVAADEWLDRYFGQFLETGAIALLFYARVLTQAPVGLVGQAVGTAALPALAELHEQGRDEDLARLVQRTLQATLSVGILVAAALSALAMPVVTLVYERGAFGAAAAASVAAILVVFCAGIPGWVVQSVAVRPFYARGDTWRPMLLGTAVAVVAVPLYATLGPRLGTQGLAAAGALAISANALATLVLARRLHGAPDLGALAASAVRALGIAAIGGAVAYGAAAAVAGWAGATSLDAFAQCAAGGLAFAFVALPGVLWLGDDATREVVGGLISRVRRTSS